MIALARLAFRLSRFELLAATVIVSLVAIAALVIRAQLDGTAVPPSCVGELRSGFGATTEACTGPINAHVEIEQRALNLMPWMGILPFAAGVILGVPLVGRELELGTAAMAWSVAPSRRRWLVARLVPFLAYTLVAIGVLALAADILWLGREIWQPRVRFSDVSLHGPPVVGRALAALAIGALTGAMLGRTLPAAIIAVGLTFVILTGEQLAYQAWLDAEADRHVIVLDASSTANPDELFPGGTAIARGWADAQGAFFDDIAASALAPAGTADPLGLGRREPASRRPRRARRALPRLGDPRDARIHRGSGGRTRRARPRGRPPASALGRVRTPAGLDGPSGLPERRGVLDDAVSGRVRVGDPVSGRFGGIRLEDAMGAFDDGPTHLEAPICEPLRRVLPD